MKHDEAKCVIITGATDGLGLRLAKLFSQQNANLILTGRKKFADLVHPLPNGAHYVCADQSNANCIKLIKNEIGRLGWRRIDNLILNAGTGHFSEPQREAPDLLRETMTVNLVTPVLLVHELAQFFVHNTSVAKIPLRSCVTFIGSTSAKGASNFASYAASKAGLSGFVRALASEWQNRIDVQIIHPRPTNTTMQAKAGLEIGFARRFFSEPDIAAGQIMELISARNPDATLGLTQNILRRITRKFSVGKNTNMSER